MNSVSIGRQMAMYQFFFAVKIVFDLDFSTTGWRAGKFDVKK